MGDPRSLASEVYAISKLGFQLLVDEEHLIQEFSQFSIKVPEGIFEDGEKRRVTVEVKRIIGNMLPLDKGTQTRRKVWNRSTIVWPWKKTIRSAVEKAHPEIVRRYDIFAHYVVLLVPETLPSNKYNKLVKRATLEASKYVEEIDTPKHVYLQFLLAPPEQFDRF